MHTGWRKIYRTILASFQRVYENLHKITPLTLVAHRQTRRQKKCVFIYSAVINILCDVVDVNMKTRLLTSASSCTRICGTRKLAVE